MEPETQEISSIEEQKVGIQCHVSDGGPIRAITKYLLTDFIVNEIDITGKVVELKEKPHYDKPAKKNPEKQSINYNIDEDLSHQIAEILGQECLQQIEALYIRLNSGQKVSEWSILIKDIPSEKEARTKIHNFVRQKLINIESNTLDGNVIRLKYNKKLRKMDPAMRKKYIHFTLFKSNIDTMGALFKLSKVTGINQKLFSSAGLKDKRGVTTQRISVYNTDVSMLNRFYEHAQKNKQIWIQDFKENMSNDIGVGDLWGNQFGLILRLIDREYAQQLKKRVDSLKQKGMINYFGMQRFGTGEIKTYMIGAKIVQKKWKEVIESILLEKTKSHEINALKSQCYHGRLYAKGQKTLPNKFKTEKNIFKGLKQYGENYQNVFGNLPRSMRTLYCHSLQSYMWNRMVSKRIGKFGLKVVLGDLVGKQIKGFQLLKMEAEQDEEQEQKKNDEEDNQILQQEEVKYETTLITPENIDSFKLEDVILPLYGPSLDIPQDSLAKQLVNEQLVELGLTQNDFKENSNLLCFKGQYRKMIIRPKQVQHSIIHHRQKKEEVQSPFYNLGEQKQVEQGKLAAIHLQLQLPKSSYATMAIREILHMPSSFEAQMHLNKIYDQTCIE